MLGDVNGKRDCFNQNNSRHAYWQLKVRISISNLLVVVTLKRDKIRYYMRISCCESTLFRTTVVISIHFESMALFTILTAETASMVRSLADILFHSSESPLPLSLSCVDFRIASLTFHFSLQLQAPSSISSIHKIPYPYPTGNWRKLRILRLN